MKTLKDKNPLGQDLKPIDTVERFIAQQKKMLELLNAARQVDLVKNKTGISITNLIRFRLGDTFRFVIHHNLRHMEQAQREMGKYALA